VRSLPGYVLMTIVLMAMAAVTRADVPDGKNIYKLTVNPGQPYPGVAVNDTGWFDVGGYCKVVDVGDLSTLAPNAHGVPVFVPGPPGQWDNFRANAASNYQGQMTLTTCCRPQKGIATLCTEAGATPVSVDREYGKNGETDVVTRTCIDQWNQPYTDSVSVTCSGDNGPNGQAQWVESTGDVTSNCTPDAYDTGCSAACDSTSTGTRYDSCGNPSGYTCAGPPCPPPPPPTGGGGPTGANYCAPGTTISKCSIWPAYQCNAYPGGPILPTIYSDCGGECLVLNESGGPPSTWPTAGGTFTPPTCTCQNGSSPSCRTPFGPTCFVCN